MAYFEWASDMEIDQGPIDDDHKQLVEQVNLLHSATSEGRGQEIVEGLLKALVAYTENHLKREEQFMASIQFPQLDAHKRGHDKFMHKIHELQAKYDGGSITVASQLSSVLRDWLSLHIRRHDKEIKYFLDKRNLAAKRKR